jgi:cytochrome c peroxidase
VLNAADPWTRAKADLGAQLFFDPRLSPGAKMACVTCHPPEKAWADGQKVSAKFDGSLNTRNTPTMLNVGYLDRLYWDGRAPTLEKNVVAAWKNQMGGKPEEVAAALAAVPAYAKAFQDAFGAPPSEDTIGRALAAFLRDLRTADSAFDRAQAGDASAMTADQRAGWALFTGKAGCAGCHPAPLFSDTGLHNVGVGMDAEKPDPGAGGEKAANDPKLLGAFKTPTLRNVTRTAPYFHDGSVADLKAAVTWMAGPGHASPTLDPAMVDRKLTPAEIDQVVAFLGALESDAAGFKAPTLP